MSSGSAVVCGSRPTSGESQTRERPETEAQKLWAETFQRPESSGGRCFCGGVWQTAWPFPTMVALLANCLDTHTRSRERDT